MHGFGVMHRMNHIDYVSGACQQRQQVIEVQSGCERGPELLPVQVDVDHRCRSSFLAHANEHRVQCAITLANCMNVLDVAILDVSAADRGADVILRDLRARAECLIRTRVGGRTRIDDDQRQWYGDSRQRPAA